MTTFSAFKIKIFTGSSDTEFQDFYVSKTLEIEENRGFERGMARFRLADSAYLEDGQAGNPLVDPFPFIPISGQKIEIWNASEDTLFFIGRIAECSRTLIVQRDDLTEVSFFDVVCTDLKIDFERVLVSERYVDQTTGFIIRDIVRRFTFYDESAIDALAGFTLPDYRVSFKYPSQIIQQLLDIEGAWTVWFDWQQGLVYAGEADNEIQNVILSLNDSNVYDYFDADKLNLAFDESVVKTSAIFIFNQRYNEGTVYVREGSVVVFGKTVGTNNPTRFTQFVKEGAQIRINNSNTVYTISAVLSDNELRLSSPYQEETIEIASSVPYEITGTRTTIQIDDQGAIDRMALVNDESGPLAGRNEFLVPTDSNAYTREEAELIARSHLKRYTEPLITGNGESDNVKIPLAEIHAGQTIRFDLPIGKQIQATVVIQQLTKRDTGAVLCREEYFPFTDTRIDPLFQYTFGFRDRIFETRNQIKRLMADVRRGFAADDIDVESIFTINDRFIFTDDIDDPANEEITGNKYATFKYGESTYGAIP